MTGPAVSVVITAYNASRYLPETLESALAQTHSQREIILVDDGSTDETSARIEPYLSHIRLIQREHRGLAAARNAGLRAANGEFIALLDADDLWLPEKLEVQIQIARSHPESGLIACDGVEFDGEAVTRPHLLSGAAADALSISGENEVTGNFHRGFIEHVNIRCPAQTLLPRRVVEKVGPFGDFKAQDYDYYLRVSARFPVTFHRHSLVCWRDRPGSMSGPRSRHELTWSRQKLPVLRAHEHCCEPADGALVARQVVRNRAEMAFHYGETFNRWRATRALLLLLRQRPWPPAALPFLLALCAPRLARRAYRAFVGLKRILFRTVSSFGRGRKVVGQPPS
jgi:glycosyltransferase involved in cell wall biosynthesis